MMFKKLIHFVLTVAFLFLCWSSFMVFTSLLSPSLPWYEPCGLQFLGIILFFSPAMIFIGVAFLVLSQVMPINRITWILPLASAFIIWLLACCMFHLEGQMTGALYCVFASLASIACFVADMARKDVHGRY